jgi:hypothetical protein
MSPSDSATLQNTPTHYASRVISASIPSTRLCRRRQRSVYGSNAVRCSLKVLPARHLSPRRRHLRQSDDLGIAAACQNDFNRSGGSVGRKRGAQALHEPQDSRAEASQAVEAVRSWRVGREAPTDRSIHSRVDVTPPWQNVMRLELSGTSSHLSSSAKSGRNAAPASRAFWPSAGGN